MKYQAEIVVMPLKELLDPQGKTVAHNIKNLNINGVKDVRIGKHIVMHLEAESEASAKEQVESACKKLLANPVMESYHFSLNPA